VYLCRRAAANNPVRASMALSKTFCASGLTQAIDSAGMSVKVQIGVVAAMLAAFSMWAYVDLVLIPFQKAEATAAERPRGNLSDLYPRWLGAKELILHGRDPYSAEVTREIQEGYYGRQLDATRPHDPKDQQGFAYPVYVVFLLAPTVWLPFPPVQAGFRWVLLGLTVVAIPLWLRTLKVRSSAYGIVTWVAFTVGSYAAVQGLKLQQLTLLVCALLAGCAAALTSGYLALAGVLLALSTIKPQLAIIAVAWLGLWTISSWRQRKRLAWGFIATMVLLLLGAQVLLPGWIGKFRAAATEYMLYTGGGKSVLDVALGSDIGKFVAVLMLAALAPFLWQRRSEEQGTMRFTEALALVLALTLVVIPTYAPYNQLLLLPALMLIVNWLGPLWQKGTLQRALVVITGIAVFWPWGAALALDIGLLISSRERIERMWALPLYSSLAIPVLVLALMTVAVSSLREDRTTAPEQHLRINRSRAAS
jgi:hypothetical protein